MGDRLATVDMGRKVGTAVSHSVGGAGSLSNTMWPGIYLRAKLHLDSSSPFGYNRHGPKSGGADVPPFLGGANTICLIQCRLGRGLPLCQVAS